MMNERKLTAALLVAQDRLSNKQIAAKVGIAERTLDAWKKDKVFQATVEEYLETWRQRVEQKGIADRRRRLYQLNERWRKLQSVVEKRAKDPTVQHLPGGNTGFISRKLRSLPKGFGERAVVEEAVFDRGLFRSFLEVELRVAKELRQWDELPERKIRRVADLSSEELSSVLADIRTRRAAAEDDSLPLNPPDDVNDGN